MPSQKVGKDPSTRRKAELGEIPNTRVPFPVLLLLIGLIIPANFNFGDVRLTPYRIILIIYTVPCLITLFSGRVGRVRSFDLIFLGHAVYAGLALVLAHGIGAAWQAIGIYFFEFFVSYLFARCYLRTREQFCAFSRLIFVFIAMMLPFVVFESFTGTRVLIQLIDIPLPVFELYYMEPRWGLERAFGLFKHPIHYGVFCAGIFGILFYSGQKRFLKTCIVPTTATFFSLSAGPITALVVQFLVVAWNYATQSMGAIRWKVIGVISVVAYFAVDLLSNRTPPEVFISYLTFNTESSYNRILIWRYGTAEVYRHPLFGIGLGEWLRPYWMSASMDNFWLVFAVRYGIPGLLFVVVGTIILMRCIAMKKMNVELDKDLRLGWFVSLIGLIVAGATVHYWDALLVYYMMIVGSGAWMLDLDENDTGIKTVRLTRSASRRRLSPSTRVKS